MQLLQEMSSSHVELTWVIPKIINVIPSFILSLVVLRVWNIKPAGTLPPHIPCMLFSLSIQVQALPRAALEHNSAAKWGQPSEKLHRSLCSPYRATLTDIPWTALRTNEGWCAHYSYVLINILSTFCGVQRLRPNCTSCPGYKLRGEDSVHKPKSVCLVSLQSIEMLPWKGYFSLFIGCTCIFTTLKSIRFVYI